MNFKGVLCVLIESINFPSNVLEKYDNKKEVSRPFFFFASVLFSVIGDKILELKTLIIRI